jgi:glycosyltransferase involved in cell wall biosynthesis
MRTCSVIVCTHSVERLNQVRKCVHSVREGTHLPEEFFVVVDGNPGLRETLARELGPSVAVLDSDGHGASAARNTALQRARGEVIACIDDDAWAEPDWLAELLTPFDDDAICGAGGRILPDWQDEAHTLPPELLWIVGATYAGHPEGPGPFSRPIGANMAGRRLVMTEIGGFSPEFGPNGVVRVNSNEEFVLFGMIQDIHGPDSVWYVPTAVVHHYAPVYRTRWPYLRRRCLVEGTSKANVRSVRGADAMHHDHDYVVGTLIPAIRRDIATAIREHSARPAVDALKITAAFSLTAVAYVLRRATARVTS